MRQAAENGVISHAQWQARNGQAIQGSLNDRGRRTRQLLRLLAQGVILTSVAIAFAGAFLDHHSTSDGYAYFKADCWDCTPSAVLGGGVLGFD